MTREDTKKLLPIIKAFSEGKTIQCFRNNVWEDIDNISTRVLTLYNFRIKPEPKYRPFENAEECWNEMLKHKPLGWVKASHGHFQIVGVRKDDVYLTCKENWQSYEYLFTNYKFADGSPFGILEKE